MRSSTGPGIVAKTYGGPFSPMQRPFRRLMQTPRLRVNAGFFLFFRNWNEALKLTFFTLRFLRSLRETENLVNPVNPVNNTFRPCALCLSEHSVDLSAYGVSRYRGPVQSIL